MRAFEVIQSKLNALGIYPTNKMEHPHFNSTNFAILTIFILNIIVEIEFLFNEIGTYQEFSSACYSVASGLLSIIFYVSLVQQTNGIFQLMDDLAAFTSTSSIFNS